ncbi:MAG: N-acetylneuraminate synthase family protein [Spirochaetota bacterium]
MLFLKDIFHGKELIFIAEIGLNHNGNIDTARKMIIEARNAGADAVKFQTFIPENMNSAYTGSLIKYGIEKEPTKNEYNFFKKFVLSKIEYHELAKLASELNIEFFSSPFDTESVDLLEELNVKLYKIASSEVTNHILLERIAATKKPVIMSTGISSEKEISMAIDLLNRKGTPDVILMHCVSLYPLPPENANLKRINSLSNRFGLETGYSDHTKDSKTCELAAALGSGIFEKHFTLSKELDCPDKDISLTPAEFQCLIESVKLVKSIIGNGKIDYGNSEKEVARLARKSLFAKKDIHKDELISYNNVIPKRPGIGIPAYELKNIIGKKVNTEIKEDYLLRMEFFD